MNISPSGVVIGAMPPLTPGGRLSMAEGQAFANLLAGPVDVGAILEIDGDIGQGVFRHRAQQALMRNAEHFLLDRHGEAGFDFLRRHAGAQDDLDLGGRYIGKGVDGQTEQGLDAGADEQRGEHQHQQALGQGKTDQGRRALFPCPPRSTWLSNRKPLDRNAFAGFHPVGHRRFTALADEA